MTAAELTTFPAGRRRQAAGDLAIWVAAVGLLIATSYAVKLAGAPLALRLILGEPIDMIALLLVSTLLLRRRGERWRDVGLKRPPTVWRTAGLVLGGLIAAFGANALLVLFVFRALGIGPPNIEIIAALVRTPWMYASMLALTWTTVAFGEELQFRGFVFTRLEILFGNARPGALAAWLGQGLLFGLLHAYQGLGGVLATASAGLLLGAIYLAARRSLVPSVVLHGLVDTISLTTVFYVVNHRTLVG